MAGNEIAVATGAIALFQYLAGSVAITIAQTVFQNELGPALSKYAPSVEARSVLDSGATGFRAVIPADQLPNVLTAYNDALVKVFVSNYEVHVMDYKLIVLLVYSYGHRWSCTYPQLLVPVDQACR